MMSSQNVQMKSRFFSLYWGQKIIKVDDRDDLVNPYVAHLTNDGRYTTLNTTIHLRPLTSISDEDAINVATMIVGDRFENPKLIGQAYAFWLNKDPNYNLDWKVVEYFRKKGYACPFEGLSVEEMEQLGWIKLIDTP